MDQNVSNNSTSTNNNSSAPNTPPNIPNETSPIGEGFETIAKTSEEDFLQLNAAIDETNRNDNGDANEDDGAQDWVPRSMFVALIADGSNTSVVEQVGGNNHVKKRKYKLVSDPPVGIIPTCPVCKKEFATWRATFGHMNKHPQRPYRGFFPHPIFTPTAPVTEICDIEDNGCPNKVDEGELEMVRELVIDLNRSIGAPVESFDAGGSSGRNAEAPAPTPENEEGKRKNVFDLNKLPPNDDDDDDDDNDDDEGEEKGI